MIDWAAPFHGKYKKINGLGLSDWDGISEPLRKIFNYKNTFFHEEPFLDICNPPPELTGTADFLISSDVFEHVPFPAIRAFEGAASVLTPGGLLVLTVPFGDASSTIEHYPGVTQFEVVQLCGEWVLIGRTIGSEFELHRSPVFHGGAGTTVEMRIFSIDDVTNLLKCSGFEEIKIHNKDVPEWGVFEQHGFGVPVTARRKVN